MNSLADKIIKLRKKNGWSQEDLAERMNVSRQAVSKWESAQAMPDLERIVQMSNLFGVTTDYLLKNDIEEEETLEQGSTAEDTREESYAFADGKADVKHVTADDAKEYIEGRAWASPRIAFATFLCIISPICLIILGAASEKPEWGIQENFAACVGLLTLFILVAAAVAIFIQCAFKNTPYEFLEKEYFEIDTEAKKAVAEMHAEYTHSYTKNIMLGVCICIVSPGVLMFGALSDNDFMAAVALGIMLFIIAVGVLFLVSAGVKEAGFKRLLKEGDYSDNMKKVNKTKDVVAAAYWLIATAIYLAWSFATENWGRTWIVWPVAGVLFGAIMSICNIKAKDDEQ